MSAGQTTASAPVLDYATLPQPSRRGKGFLSVCGSLLLPGLGHVIAGFRRRGVFWFVLVLACAAVSIAAGAISPLVPALIVLIPIGILLNLTLLVDAYRYGHRSSTRRFGGPLARYVLGVGILAIAVFAAPAQWAAVPVRRFLVEALMMPTASMAPTLQPRDRILCHKRDKTPSRWSIVVFEPPTAIGQRYAHRVVGLPGETIEIRDGQVHVNGQVKPAPAGAGPYVCNIPGMKALNNPGCTGNPVLLGRDEYYVLGDNSPIAGDSRTWNVAFDGHQLGAVPGDKIKRTVTYIYWPPSRWRRLD